MYKKIKTCQFDCKDKLQRIIGAKIRVQTSKDAPDQLNHLQFALKFVTYIIFKQEALHTKLMKERVKIYAKIRDRITTDDPTKHKLVSPV